MFRGLVCVCTNPSAWEGVRHMVKSKWSLTGLNSEFFLTENSWHIQGPRAFVCPTILKYINAM